MTNYDENLLNSMKPLPRIKGQLNGIYTPSLVRELNNTKSHLSYRNKKNYSRNVSDCHSFPTNYPSTAQMENSMPTIGVNMGPVPW